MLHLDETIELANTQNLSHIEWLLKLSDYEVAIKQQNILNHMVEISNFPHLKTHLATSLGIESSRNRRSTYFIKCHDLIPS